MRTQVARIHQVLSGHSERALVHAVDADGLEYKLEVPADAARGLSSGHVLWIAWTAHAMPPALEPALPAPTPADAAQADAARAEAEQTASSSGTQTPDEQFITLMGARSARPSSETSAKAPSTESGRSTQDLAELLGVRLSEPRRA